MLSHAIDAYNTHHGLRLNPKVVLFDMDGTLIDSMPNHAVAWTAAFEQIGVPFSTNDAYLAEGSRGVDTIRNHLLACQHTLISEEQAKAIYARKAAIFASLPTPPLMDGALELMATIRQSGLKIGIVTGSAQQTLLERIKKEFCEYVMEQDITTAFDVNKGKPDPEPYLKGMAKSGCEPHETIVVENAPLGIEAAHRSGAFTIAVNTGPLSDEILLAAGADVLFKSIRELATAWEQAAETSRQVF